MVAPTDETEQAPATYVPVPFDGLPEVFQPQEHSPRSWRSRRPSKSSRRQKSTESPVSLEQLNEPLPAKPHREPATAPAPVLKLSIADEAEILHTRPADELARPEEAAEPVVASVDEIIEAAPPVEDVVEVPSAPPPVITPRDLLKLPPLVITPEPDPIAAPEPAPIAELPEPVVGTPEPEPIVVAPELEPVAVVAEPEPVVVVPEPEPVVAAEPEPEPVAVVVPVPEPVAVVVPVPEPVVVAEPEPEPEPVAVVAPEPEPVPAIPGEPEPVIAVAAPSTVADPATPPLTTPRPVPAPPAAPRATEAAPPARRRVFARDARPAPPVKRPAVPAAQPASEPTRPASPPPGLITYDPAPYDPGAAAAFGRANLAVVPGQFGVVYPARRSGRGVWVTLVLIVLLAGGVFGWQVVRGGSSNAPSGVAYTSRAAHFTARFPSQPTETSESHRFGRVHATYRFVGVSSESYGVMELQLSRRTNVPTNKALTDMLRGVTGTGTLTLLSKSQTNFDGHSAQRAEYYADSGSLISVLDVAYSGKQFYLLVAQSGDAFDNLKASFVRV